MVGNHSSQFLEDESRTGILSLSNLSCVCFHIDVFYIVVRVQEEFCTYDGKIEMKVNFPARYTLHTSSCIFS